MITIGLLGAAVVAIVLGLTTSSAGLLWVGVLWVGVAVLGVRHARRLQAIEPSAVTTPMMLQGAVVFLVGGIPAVLVGLTEWRIADPELRWIPIVVGAILTVFAVATGGLFSLASGIQAAQGDPPTVPATIVIVSAQETGTFINERPRIEFVLDVTPEGQPTYRATKKATVPFTALGSIKPGDGFRALVAGPEEPEKMEIDWAATLPGDRS